MKIKNIFAPSEQITFDDYMVKCGVEDTNLYLSNQYVEPWQNYDNIIEEAQAISNAVKMKDNIYILMDCDVDGVGTALVQYLYLLKCDPTSYIKILMHNKNPKAHGLADDEIMDKLRDPNNPRGTLWIGDAGSMNIDECKEVSELGYTIVISDHHDMPSPNSCAIVVNNQTSSKVTNKSLSGCGVTFKVCQAIDYINNTNYSRDLISFVHLTNISDSCKFVHPEQQTFRYWGVQMIYPTLQPFIDAFNYKGGLDNKSFSFGIIGRINAVIRIGTLEQKQTLFLALALGMNVDEAIDICKKCKAEQDKTRDEIIESGLTLRYNGQINIYETDVATPLTGLIANKLQDRDNRTVFVVHNFNGKIKGSCRSPYDEEDVNIRQLCDQSNEFNYASGHSSAFGVSWDYLNSQDVYSWIWSLTLSEPNIATLGSWTTKSIPKYLFSEFGANTSLYGQGMKEPLAHIHSITVNQGDIREMGANGRTLKLSKDGIDIMWFMISNEDKKALLNTPYELELVGTMGVNKWNGRKTPQIIVEKYEISDLKKKTLEDIF